MHNINSSRNFAPWLDKKSKPLLEFKNIAKSFGDHVAVRDISFSIYEKEFFALLGSSGCGKTTLLRIVAGFEQPTKGSILLDGKEINKTPPHKRAVNLMFQNYALFPHMNVWNNIAFGIRQDKLKKSEIKLQVDNALELVQMSSFAYRKPHQLSGGQKQRVALARSLVKKPKVLLLDEPLGALDKKLREETQLELMNLQEELGIAFVIVTHDQEEAMTVADRIAIMHNGDIKQIGVPGEIYEAPNNKFVSQFIGDINIFEGRLTITKDTKTGNFTTNSGLSFNNLKIDSKCSKKATYMALRPEKISISQEKPLQESKIVLPATVFDIAYRGNLSIFKLELKNGDIIKAFLSNSEKNLSANFTWDNKVFISWDQKSIIWLEK